MALIPWIPIAPMIGAFVLMILYIASQKGFNVPQKVFALTGVSAPILSAIFTLIVFFGNSDYSSGIVVSVFKWIHISGLDINIDFYLDSLSMFMILFITFIGSLIHIYSIGYMDKEEGFGKFFLYLNLFLGSMLILVLAFNPLLMFIGWEGVGICSYLLIAFYYEHKDNVKAGNKAFIMNRVGDFGFIIGIILLFLNIGEGDFNYISIQNAIGGIPEDTLFLIALCIFIGACGKSAQIPLFTWLPDAMAGPTPVSALIHAATMVTAGVYIIMRFSFLYSKAFIIGDIIAYIGAFTALIAAIIATSQNDIKKILAYSTISQLGYMFLAVGLGSYISGIFHVFTHAFFKALLFLCAGSIIIALHHEQNILKMGELRKHLKLIYFCMLIGVLSIAGIPPFSGFFSKDEILFMAFSKEYYFLYAIGMLSAFLTSYYMFRLFFLVFYGKAKHKHHVANTGYCMNVVLVILACGAILAGFIGAPIITHEHILNGFLSKFIYDNEAFFENHSLEHKLMIVSVFVSLCGIFLSFKHYFKGQKEYMCSGALLKVIKNKLYIDEIYDFVFRRSMITLSKFFDVKIDKKCIKAIIENSSYCIYAFSKKYSSNTQLGLLRAYGFYMLFFMSLLLMYISFSLRAY